MKISKLLYFFMIALVIPSSIAGAEIQSGSIGFGLSNQDGTKVIVTDPPKGFVSSSGQSLDEPSQITSVIASSGQLLKVRFLKNQQMAKDYNGRQTAQQFEKMPGPVFKIVSGQISEPGACVLVGQDFLDSVEILGYSSKAYEPLAKNDVLQIESTRKKEIKGSWVLAEISETGKIAVVLFKESNDEHLASLVLIRKHRLNFRDILGRGDKISRWRVDDEGEFRAESFKVMFVYKNEDQIGIVYSWLGFEGTSLAMLETDKTNFRDIKTGYHYQAPQ